MQECLEKEKEAGQRNPESGRNGKRLPKGANPHRSRGGGADVADRETSIVGARQSGAKSNSHGTQPPASSRHPFRSQEADGCGLIQTVHGTNHILVIVEIR
jgi:hypothetical protein